MTDRGAFEVLGATTRAPAPPRSLPIRVLSDLVAPLGAAGAAANAANAARAVEQRRASAATVESSLRRLPAGARRVPSVVA